MQVQRASEANVVRRVASTTPRASPFHSSAAVGKDVIKPGQLACAKRYAKQQIKAEKRKHEAETKVCVACP